MTPSSSRKKMIAAIVLIVLIAIGAGFYVTRQPPGGTTTTVGLHVPNSDTLIEETAREPGPGGYDPALTWDAGGNYVMENVYEMLVYYDGSSPDKLIPWLAERWDVSSDGLTYTFHLRQGIKFHDGTPFNATAVKFSIDRAILVNHADGPEFLIAPQETMAIKGGPRYFTAETVSNYNASEAKIYLAQEGVKVLDLYMVQITLEHPYAPALATMAFTVTGIVSPSYVIANCPGSAEMPGVTPGIECEFMRTHAAGTGPYKLVEVTPKSRVVLERYDGYWGGPQNTGPAKLSRYLISYVPEMATRQLDLYAGTADGIQLKAENAFGIIDRNAWLSTKEIKPLKNGVRVWSAPTVQILDLALNPRFPPLDNVDFRRAVAYAFPYDKFINQVLNGFAVKKNALIPKGMLGYDLTLPGYDYNPDKARELFRKVGFNGTLEFLVEANEPNSLAATLLLKDSLSELAGINIEIKEVDTASYLTLFHDFNVPVLIFRWTQDIADPAVMVANFATPAGFQGQTSQFNNATIIQMVQEAGASLDPTRRAQLYREIQLEMLRKVITIPILSPIALFAERDWVLPADEPVGRGVYNSEYGDGDGGVQGGYHAYYVTKAETTPQVSIIIGNSPIGTSNLFAVSAVCVVSPFREH